MAQLARREDEAAALVRLGFDELHDFARNVGTMERAVAARAFRHGPLGKPIQFVHDAMSNGGVGAPGGATDHIALLNHPAVYEKLREWLR